MRLNFKVEAQASGSHARAGRFRTLHNEVLTPLFMPVGTQATVKAQHIESLEEAGSQILLANTYHLLLRPGPEIFRALGGIHKFTTWKRSFLTDSGGFQIFSLSDLREMQEQGAVFRSHLDGRKIMLSPELSIDTQKAIGSDIMMVLDQCVNSTVDHAVAKQAMEITHRWAKRSLDARGDSPQSMFGIVQGALFKDLRKQSAETLGEMPFDGFAIGGLAVGEGKQEREDTCEYVAPLLPKDRPRYMMGVGTPIDLLEAVHRGVDMFDCVLPTKLGGRGGAYTSRGHVQLRRGIYRTADEPLDPNCPCPTCKRFSRAYLSHLTRTQEVFGWTLIGQHNIWFYHQLMREMRESILKGTFLEYYREKRQVLAEDDLDHPIHQPKINHSKRKAQPALNLGDYEVVLAQDAAGVEFGRIRQISSGEIMHSKEAPWVEANALYIEQSQLRKKLVESTESPLVIWDVGLGAAANAMAAIRVYEELAQSGQSVRPLQIISFENDLDSLTLASRHLHQFPYLMHGAPSTLLKTGSWQSKTHSGLSWSLHEGDFNQFILNESIAAPDLIFFDLFSYKTQGDDWESPVFSKIRQRVETQACELFTYSSSTRVRTALLAAGFFIAKGRATADKSETTIGLTDRAVKQAAASGSPAQLLGLEWLTRWKRSGAKFPEKLPVEDQPAFESAILSHPQWSV